MSSDTASLENQPPCPWYEKPDGTCNLDQPTLVTMGEGQPVHLMFPVHWTQSLQILPQAKKMAGELQAMLVLLIHGEASDREIAELIIQLAGTEVLPLWIGEQNRRQVDQIITMLASQIKRTE